MSGTLVYEEKINNKINNLLEAHSDKEYLRNYRNFIHDMEKSSIYSYVSYVLAFIEFTNKEPKDLTLNDYTNYTVKMEDKTSSYRITVFSALKRFSEFLYFTHVCPEDYMKVIRRPKAITSDQTFNKRQNAFLEENEIIEYVQHVNEGAGSSRAKARQLEWKERDELIILLLLNTGMRCSALYKLDVSSFDFEKQILIARDKGNKRNEYNLEEELITKIKAWLIKREELLAGKEEEALFISNRRVRMTQLSISRIVTKYAENIKGKNITPHKLRATYGTTLYNETADIYFVQKCMGHSSPNTTTLYIRGKKDINKAKSASIMKEKTITKK